VLSGDRAAMAKLSLRELEEIVFATHAGMTVEAFNAIAAEWASKAKDHRWRKPYTELVYQPMQEVLALLRAHGYRTYIVTGGGQAFVRSYAERAYGIGPADVIGSTLATKYGYDADGQGVLLREPKLDLNNNNSGKAEDIYLFTGDRPQAAFGNSTGDRQMLEWATGGAGRRLGMLVLHDDAEREYAYGPAAGLPDTKVGTFSQELMDEARRRGWTVVSMRTDWKAIFPEPVR
jgi:phosphoserine phosphatase